MSRLGDLDLTLKLSRTEEADQKLADAQAMIDEIAALFKNEDYRRMFVESALARLTTDDGRPRIL